MNIPFTDNARKIFDGRYPRKDEHGNPTETPEQVIERVASNVAIVNSLYDTSDAEQTSISTHEFPWKTLGRQLAWLTKAYEGDGRAPVLERVGRLRLYERQKQTYIDLLSSLTFLPNSPTWTGAGTPLMQLAACFVLPIADDLADGRSSIFETMRVAAQIQQTGGGNGFHFGLRPRAEIVRRSMGLASGPVGFMTAYDQSFEVIAQGGSRRGANMGVLRIDHPDVKHFVNAKTEEGKLRNFNISVAITDDFMKAVEKDEDFDLKFGTKVYETVKAKDLFDFLVEKAHIIGDPGCLFIDRANQYNPCPTRYVLEATNPCGEQWLPPYSNCCLGSIDVSKFVVQNWWDDGVTEGDFGVFDWTGFAIVIEQSTQFLDDVVDANNYVPGVPELEEAAMNERRIGLGLMGVADTMIKLGIGYGTEDGLDFLSQLTEFFRYHTMCTSINRAMDRGAFPWIEKSMYDPNLLATNGAGGLIGVESSGPGHRGARLWAPPTPIVEHIADFGRPEIDWDLVLESLKKHGIRNACQTTVAPTGTISNVAGCEGSGCEPVFALSYVRMMLQEGTNGETRIELPYLSRLLDEALDGLGLADKKEGVLEALERNQGSLQAIPGIPERLREVFVVAADVSPEDHVRSQAVMQAFIDNSISKTINFPNDATVEDVAKAYKLAFHLGCKGITIYRQGSRQLEVLATTKDKKGHEVEWPHIVPLAIPDYAKTLGLAARVFPIETFFGKVQVTITHLEGYPDRPFDVRLQIGKGGNDKNADVEAIGRMISLNLRLGGDVEYIVEQLEGIGGATAHGMGANKVRSVADGVAKLLRKHYMTDDASWTTASTSDEDRLVVDTTRTCPDCGMASIVVEAGCSHCDVRLGGCGSFSACD